MTTWLLLISVSLIAISGIPALLLDRRSMLGQWSAAILNVAGSGLGGAALVLHHLRQGMSEALSMPWALPLGRFAVAVDDLSLVFLIPIFLISALGSVYGLSYWPQREHPGNGTRLRLCWGLLTAGMALVVLARDGVLFLIAWEIMALAGFFLVCTEESKAEVRQAGWVYLVATHLGTICQIGFFALLHRASGSFDLWPSLPADLSPHVATSLFVLGAVGFGLKAGIMPLHVWLPGAHANAPSHVSAILSGVLLKTGVYGLLRVTALMPHPPLWWGSALLVAGTLSAVVAIAFAAAQHDLKRLLAYSSIENVGIVILGAGLATLGRSLGRPAWVTLGLGGALLHMINHSLFKPLLFMGAGAVLHATRTRRMDLLGGLGRSMPKVFVLFLIAAVAICGLPPLNGFVGELLLYIGLFTTALETPATLGWVALAAPALAVVGAMAVASFIKLVCTVFVAAPRSPHAAGAHDPDWKMTLPMWVMAAGCLLIGVFPQVTFGALDRATASWAPQMPQTTAIANHLALGWLTALPLLLLATVTSAALWFWRGRTHRAQRHAGTWDCGYALPTPRMQYSGSSFSQMIVELLSWIVWPARKPPRIDGVFPSRSNFASDVGDVVLDRALLPAFSATAWLLGWARIIQRGPIQVYLLYVLGILIMLLLFA